MLRISVISPAESKSRNTNCYFFWLFLLMISSFDSGTTHTNEKWYFRLIHFIYKPRAGLTSLDSLVIKTKILTTFSVDEICSSKKRLCHDVILSHSVATFRIRGVFSFKSPEFQQNRHISRIVCVRTLLASSNNHDNDDGKKKFKNAADFITCLSTIK